jgi:hypothetical protein
MHCQYTKLLYVCVSLKRQSVRTVPEESRGFCQCYANQLKLCADQYSTLKMVHNPRSQLILDRLDSETRPHEGQPV